MVDVILMRAVMRERMGLTAAAVDSRGLDGASALGWVPARRITYKRLRECIPARDQHMDGRHLERDARGRISRRRTNLDVFSAERRRLLDLVHASAVPQPESIPWRLPALKRRTKEWLTTVPPHCVPGVRHLAALPPTSGSLHWRCLRCGTIRSHVYH
eukprot:6489883-Amphidinium_carterae.1